MPCKLTLTYDGKSMEIEFSFNKQDDTIVISQSTEASNTWETLGWDRPNPVIEIQTHDGKKAQIAYDLEDQAKPWYFLVEVDDDMEIWGNFSDDELAQGKTYALEGSDPDSDSDDE